MHRTFGEGNCLTYNSVVPNLNKVHSDFVNAVKFIKRYRLFEMLQNFAVVCFPFLIVSGEILKRNTCAWFISVLLQIYSSFAINDYYDWESDQFNSRKIVRLQRPHLKSIYIIFSCALIFALNVSVKHVILIAIASFVAVLYSAPLVHLKGRMFFSSITHFLMGMTYFLIGWYLVQDDLNLDGVLSMSICGLALVSGGLGNEQEDREVDQNFKITTLANQFPRLCRWIILSSQMAALILLAVVSSRIGAAWTLKIVLICIPIYAITFIYRNWSSSAFRRLYRSLFLFPLGVLVIERFFSF